MTLKEAKKQTNKKPTQTNQTLLPYNQYAFGHIFLLYVSAGRIQRPLLPFPALPSLIPSDYL